jgi:predicted ester cyclase
VARDLKERVRRTYECFETGKLDGLDDIVAADCIDHNPLPGVPGGLDGLKQSIELLRNAFSALTVDIRDQVEEGDTCVTRAIISGTHTGAFLGIPATGRDASVEIIDIIRYGDDGKAIEHWGLWDQPALLVQLGIVPAPDGGNEA